jgi:hypothetical protein
MRVAGEVTSHQFRILAQLRFFTSVVTMLHNSPDGIPDKAIYSIVGHSLGKDVHMKNYMAGLKPQALIKAVEAINWDTWEWQ